MKKEVESLGEEKSVAKVPAQIDGKELVQLFKSMSVSRHGETRQLRDSKDWRASKNLVKPSRSKPLKNKKVKQKRKPKRLNLRPSKLTLIVDRLQADKKAPDSRFSEFSADCSKALETIEKSSKAQPKKLKKKVKKPNRESVPEESAKPRVQKKRKASSSCAQQARNVCYNNSEVDLSIDYLADYLEETIVFPKKMSYMAELMYT